MGPFVELHLVPVSTYFLFNFCPLLNDIIYGESIKTSLMPFQTSMGVGAAVGDATFEVTCLEDCSRTAALENRMWVSQKNKNLDTLSHDYCHFHLPWATETLWPEFLEGKRACPWTFFWCKTLSICKRWEKMIYIDVQVSSFWTAISYFPNDCIKSH